MDLLSNSSHNQTDKSIIQKGSRLLTVSICWTISYVSLTISSAGSDVLRFDLPGTSYWWKVHGFAPWFVFLIIVLGQLGLLAEGNAINLGYWMDRKTIHPKTMSSRWYLGFNVGPIPSSSPLGCKSPWSHQADLWVTKLTTCFEADVIWSKVLKSSVTIVTAGNVPTPQYMPNTWYCLDDTAYSTAPIAHRSWTMNDRICFREVRSRTCLNCFIHLSFIFRTRPP